jgi:hypothetical protein
MAKIGRFHHIGGPEVLKIEEGPSRILALGDGQRPRNIRESKELCV